MKPLHAKKAIALFENRMRAGFIIITVVCYFFAFVLWYGVCVVAPYVPEVRVSPSDNAMLTREAFSATKEQAALPDEKKDRALLMPTSEGSFQRRLKLIADATSSIDYMIFATFDEEFSYIFYGAMLDAADRGVKIRILLDGKLGRLNGNFSEIENAVASHANIKLYYYNEFDFFDPAGAMVLLHDKMMIADGKTMIIGGVNMGKCAYLANYDMEVMITSDGVENGAVEQAQEYYEKVVKSELSRRKKTAKSDPAAKNGYILQYKKYFEESEFADMTIDYGTLGVPVDRVTVLGNKIGLGKRAPIIWQALCNLAEDSKRTTLVTPYALLDGNKINKLRSISAKSDEFNLVTNSLYNTRNAAYADYYNRRKDYLKSNINLYEYQEKDQLHAKLASFDGRYSVIGSFNLDERSAHIDNESVVIIDSQELNAEFEKYLNERFMSHSLKVGDDNRYIPSDSVPARSAPFGKRLKYAFYSVFSLVGCLL